MRKTERERRRGGSRTSFDALRTERWIAVIRLAVIGVVMAIFAGSDMGRQTPPALIAAVLGLAVVYGAWSLVVFAGMTEPSLPVRLLSVLADTILVTAWVVVTDGAMSDFWALYLVVVISAGMRFDLVQTAGISMALVLLYSAIAMADGRLPRELVLHRTSLIVITGFAVGVLSQQRLVHRRQGQTLRAEAEERSRELDDERAEVERLRRVDSAKSEFVAVAAHEFRTPLAAVIGVLSTLREHGSVLTPDDRIELLDGATSQANRLARLVDDLLTVSRIEDGILRLSLETAQPRNLLSEAAQVSGMAGRLVIRIGRVGAVRCDPDAIIRVLTNLMDNARKYAPPDSKVHIDVTLERDMVRFSVADEGPGIPDEDRVEIFERFRRLEGGKTKPGAGLGLYICRGLVEAHGGTICADRAPGGGAQMSFTLPRSSGRDETADAFEGNGHVDGVVAHLDAPGSVEELPPAAVR
ncbi:MAG TPA: ATP-binding protein [Actinomycetota bacterium]|nr:ATP-binding protein [Actinomycetota bacterium]